MSSVQHQLSQYLQYELYHLLGAYGIAETRLQKLAQEFETIAKQPPQMDPYGDQDDSQGGGDQPDHLRDLASLAAKYNRDLSWHRHGKPVGRATRKQRGDANQATRKQGGNADEPGALPMRDPIPHDLPLTSPHRFDVDLTPEETADAREHLWKTPSDWRIVPKFYGQALRALENYDAHSLWHPELIEGERTFAKSLVARRDSVFTPSADNTSRMDERAARRVHRRNRYVHRLRDAISHLSPPHFGEPQPAPELSEAEIENYESESVFLEQIVKSHLSSGPESLPIFVVRALAEAHMSMHAVEAWKAMCLAEEAETLSKKRREWLDEELMRCIALNTFAYCASRTAPWMFAADESESQEVFKDSKRAWEMVVPARGMWIASQVSLLALHRRAYARSLQSDSDQAYNDYHKLHRLIRDAERRVKAAPIRVDGALEFLDALDAQAHHHIGELYRREHAHKQARRHFAAAWHRLESLRADGKMNDVLTNSRWRVELQVSHGKTSYEMGRHKEALCWHLRGWSAFLKLLAADTSTKANTKEIDTAIKWLERVIYEPEVSKSDVRQYLGPVVGQLTRVTVSRRYGALAGEILLRLGHLLFVLNLGDEISMSGPAGPHGITGDDLEQTLAYACLVAAARYDKYSTLIAADRLKALFRFEKQHGVPAVVNAADMDSALSVTKSWSRGESDYERIARSTEYLLLRAQLNWKEPTKGSAMRREDACIARELLLSFFMSTDSINVRKSQVHRLMMRKPSKTQPPCDSGKAAIEFICMRRYSSAFPLLPRPSAFRALGGGYFMRLHRAMSTGSREPSRPFGIAIDPGFDFIENLYRTDYSLSDINMVVVTHDHVDHAGNLDALISLWHVRSKLLREQKGGDPIRPLVILVSESVNKRYEATGLYMNSKEFCFKSLNDLVTRPHAVHKELTEKVGFPREFKLASLATEYIDGKGHLDLSGMPASGICVRAKGGRSVAIAGDAPKPPEEGSPEYGEWISQWLPALEADVLIVHLSSVPLTELRQLADPRSVASGVVLEAEEKERLLKLRNEVNDLDRVRAQLVESDVDGGLSAQIEYGLWLGSKGKKRPVSLAGGVGPTWKSPAGHAFLRGTLSWARTYRLMRGEARGGLFIVGELSEELGSMRGRVAANINQYVYDLSSPGPARDGDGVRSCDHGRGVMAALSADIGLRVFVVDDGTTGEHDRERGDVAVGIGQASRVHVLCTTCNLDTDRVLTERYHVPAHIVETCVKGENEGIFYNCLEHAPALQNEPVFLEQLERFDIFGR